VESSRDDVFEVGDGVGQTRAGDEPIAVDGMNATRLHGGQRAHAVAAGKGIRRGEAFHQQDDLRVGLDESLG